MLPWHGSGRGFESPPVHLLTLTQNLYSKPVKDLAGLEGLNLKPGDRVKIEVNGNIISGTVMPRSAYEPPDAITLKLSNGYNIGVSLKGVKVLEVEEGGLNIPIEEGEGAEEIGNGPRVLILGTGGTIASRIDYRTGAVRPALSAKRLVEMIPELPNHATISVKTLMNELSENMRPAYWKQMALTVANAFMSGYEAVIIAHGTDTMHYTSAALSFALDGLPGPVVLVGSQRSSDRPSSDAYSNLLGAVLFSTKAKLSGVYVAMHGSTSDDVIAIHSGVRVRKLHTSRRDAFRSVNSRPVAHVNVNSLEVKAEATGEEKEGKLSVYPEFDDSAFLLKFYPGIRDSFIDAIVKEGVKAMILEGTGLGHVGRYVFERLNRFIKMGGFVGMTSQCIWGSVNMNVYETGRDLLSLGIVPLGDMLSEVALVKAMWGLGNGFDLHEIMPKNLRGELRERREVEA